MSESISTHTSAGSLLLRFNGHPQALTNPLSLGELLARHGMAADTVATAVNGQFVPREQRDATTLRAGDEVITFQAIVGG